MQNEVEGQKSARQILQDLFIMRYEDTDRLHRKRQALHRFPQTFSLLSQHNFQDYVHCLQEWALMENRSEFIVVFARHVKSLYFYLKGADTAAFCQSLFMICFYLLRKDDSQTRQIILSIIYDMIEAGYGLNFLKGTVRKLLEDANSYDCCEPALRIFRKAKEMFYQNEQFSAVVQHPTLSSSYKNKKILLNEMVLLFDQALPKDYLLYLLEYIASFLNDSQENITILAVSAQITGLYYASMRQLKTKEECLNILVPYYQNKLIRMRFTLINLTEKIVSLMPREGLELHMSLIYDIINNHEPQLTEICLTRIYLVMGHVPEHADNILKILLTLKYDIDVSKTLATNILKIVQTVKSEKETIEYLSVLLEGYQGSRYQAVRLCLFQSFSRNPNPAELYRFFQPGISTMIDSQNWHTRLASLSIVQEALKIQGVDDRILKLLVDFITTDKVSRIRKEAVILASRYLSLDRIRQELIPAVLAERSSSNYQNRLIVLFFIKQTYKNLQNFPNILQDFRKVLAILQQDSVVNVSEEAQQLAQKIQQLS